MEDDLNRQFSKLSASAESDGRDDLHNEESESQHDNTIENDTSGKCNLIVNYLPHDIDDGSLKSLFSEFGEIVMTKVVRDKNTKKSLGYGFVKFTKEEDASVAIEKMNGLSLGHKNLKVSIARPPSLEIRNCKLYVTNLPKEYTERDVVLLFKQFGEIIECRVLKDRNSRSNKGVAFVQFNLKSQANSALSLNGCQLEGSNRGLVVKYAEDQHKKKELSRLHSLTTSNPYRGIAGPLSIGNMGPGSMGSGGMGPGGLGPGGMGGISLSNPNMMNQSQGGQKMRGDGKSHSLSLNLSGHDMSPQSYYYSHQQQQQSIGGMYGGPSSPIQIMHPPLSPMGPGPGLGQLQQQMYLSSSQMSMPPPPDYNNNGGVAGKRGMNGSGRGRKSVPFPLDIPSMGSIGADQQPSPNWFGSLHGGSLSLGSMHLPPPYLQSPVNHHLNMALMSPTSQTSTQSSHSHQLRPPPRHQNQGHPINVGMSLHSPNGGYSMGGAGGGGGGGVTLIISNLPRTADTSLLHELFGPYGRILNAQVETDRSLGGGRGGGAACTGRGKVQMASIGQAEYAAQALNGAILYDGGVPLHVTLS